MKKIFLSLTMILGVATSFGQIWCGYIAMIENWKFDTGITHFNNYLFIDTVSNPDNIWQIGAPKKSVIDSAYSTPNAIITDTIQHYPPNDTSSFIFKQIDLGGYKYHHTVELAGYYKVNTDSLNDYGTIEISFDEGMTWINLITDSVYNNHYSWITPKPILTGNSNGWVYFWVMLANLGEVFSVNEDTVLLKFTFISDSNPDTLDGLAFDNFQFCNGVEGIEEIKNNNLIDIFPNPTNELLYINRNAQTEEETVQIFNFTGQLLFEDRNFKSNTIDIKRLNLPEGIYIMRYANTKFFAEKKFIVQHKQ